MDKLLKVDFFKNKGFLNKKAGIQFIESTKGLKNAFNKKELELEEFHTELIESFSEDMLSYDKELKCALLQCKSDNKTRLAEKKLAEKEMLKKEIINEYKIEQEKEQEKKKQREVTGKSPIILTFARFKSFLTSNNNNTLDDLKKLEYLQDSMESILYKTEMIQNDFKKLCAKYNYNPDNVIDVKKEVTNCGHDKKFKMQVTPAVIEKDTTVIEKDTTVIEKDTTVIEEITIVVEDLD